MASSLLTLLMVMVLVPGLVQAHRHIAEGCIYNIRVKTADEDWAGTDSEVSISFFNSDGDIAEIRDLDNPRNDDFERGHLDYFAVQGYCIRKVCGLTITSDGSGDHPGWKLEAVGLEYNGDSIYWNINTWLADKTLSVTIPCA